MKYHNMIFKIKELCQDQVNKGGCETCPLFDSEADCCLLHTDIPCDWDVSRIKEVMEEKNGTS